jgi:hypothetical protein
MKFSKSYLYNENFATFCNFPKALKRLYTVVGDRNNLNSRLILQSFFKRFLHKLLSTGHIYKIGSYLMHLMHN